MVSILRPRSKDGAPYLWIDRALALLAALVFYFHWWRTDGSVEKTASDRYSLLSQQKECAPQKGLVVVNFLDDLGWNLLQIAFARRMAEELCWDVSYRTMWKSDFGTSQDSCFANAMTDKNDALQKELDIDDSTWRAINYRSLVTDEQYDHHNERVKEWSLQLAKDGKAWRCVVPHCDISEKNIQTVLPKIRTTPSVRVIYLESFFANSGWFESDIWRGKMRNWLKIEPSCCMYQPPEDAVVIHIRRANQDKDGNVNIPAAVYESLLAKYGFASKPIWIVAEDEESHGLPVVEELKTRYKATVLLPKSQADSVCVLLRARILVMSPNSILSQVSGMLNVQAKELHLPIATKVSYDSLNLTGWKYHFMEDDKIVEWDVDHSRLPFRGTWES